MSENDLIIEIGAYQLCKCNQVVCGDTFLSKKVTGENRYVAVLSDGLGSGIKANVLSSLTASMALNFRLLHEPVVNAAKWVMDTLPIDSKRGISYSTFTIVDVDFEGDTTVIEYGNPSFFIDRSGTIIEPERSVMQLSQMDTVKELEVTTFKLLENDRLIVVSDGITQSGIGQAEMPFGWGDKKLRGFCAQDKCFAADYLRRRTCQRYSKKSFQERHIPIEGRCKLCRILSSQAPSVADMYRPAIHSFEGQVSGKSSSWFQRSQNPVWRHNH
jgi:hypothetical protein